MSPDTARLAQAFAAQQAPTVWLPRLRVLCGQPAAGGSCHLRARHAAGHLPPPAGIRRPGDWIRR